MSFSVFIDGSYGSTGRTIVKKLEKYPVNIISIPQDRKKNRKERLDIYRNVDCIIMCLPDTESRDMCYIFDHEDHKPYILDASTYHRNSDSWVYSFPEIYGDTWYAMVQDNKHFAIPGCYSSAFISLIRPLIENNLLSSYPLHVFGYSGYSGGGNDLIDRYENPISDRKVDTPLRFYSLSSIHKHIPEMYRYSLLPCECNIHFYPSTLSVYEGLCLLCSLDSLSFTKSVSLGDLFDTYSSYYSKQEGIVVNTISSRDDLFFCLPIYKDTIEISFFKRKDNGILLCASLNNLNKGSTSYVVQVLNSILGYDKNYFLDVNREQSVYV